VLGEERSFVFAVTRDELRVATLAPSHGILELAASLRTDLEQPRARRSRLDRTSRQLCDMLIGPILGPITPTDRLIIVPDRGLHYIPFEALELAPEPVAAGSNPHYLVASWKIGYAPSASVFLSLADRSARHGRTRERALVAFADPAPFRLGDGDEDMEVADNRVRGWAGDDAIDLRPLPGARAEAAQIAALFDPEAVTTMVGADATEKAFKELPAVRSARWIHFACHGLLDEHQPAYSALVLSPAMDDDEDGLLQSHEIAKLKLAADLVVLSACTTGLGKEVRGEGLVGLTQAFIEAGARSVIVSLWPVSDRSTARLMVRLYRGLEDGLDPPTALREAKLSLLHDASTAHPYFWSGFVVVGSTEVSEIGNESATLPPAVSRGAENEPSPGRRGPTVDEPQEE
jgi:CHAT domain-containing protein